MGRVKVFNTNTGQHEGVGGTSLAPTDEQAADYAGTTVYAWTGAKLKILIDAVMAVSTLFIRRTEALIETAVGYNSSSLTASGLILDCTADLTVTLETYSDRDAGFQFGVVASGGDVTFSGTFDSKNSNTVLAQGDTAWVVRKASTWHVAGLSS